MTERNLMPMFTINADNLRFLASQPEYLKLMVGRSYKNFHCKGMDYICLGSKTHQEYLKVYFFNGRAADRTRFLVAPHNHRYDFRTTVLRGTLKDYRFKEEEAGPVSEVAGYRNYHKYDWHTPLNGQPGGWIRRKEVALRPLASRFLQAGDSYVTSHDKIHTLRILEEDTVLLIHQYHDVIPIGTPTQTYSQHPNELKLDSLYEQFTPNEIALRLEELAQLVENYEWRYSLGI